MRRTAERIGLSDTFFLRRSSEKRYEFIRYTETYQFTQLHALLSAPPHARQSEFKSGKCGLKKARRGNFVETLNTETVQPTPGQKKRGGTLNEITHEQRWIRCSLFGSSLMRLWILVWVKTQSCHLVGVPYKHNYYSNASLMSHPHQGSWSSLGAACVFPRVSQRVKHLKYELLLNTGKKRQAGNKINRPVQSFPLCPRAGSHLKGITRVFSWTEFSLSRTVKARRFNLSLFFI